MQPSKQYVVLGLTAALAILVMPRGVLARESSESSKFKTQLTRSGSDDDMTGTVSFTSKKGRSTLRLKIKNGPPRHELKLKVGGVSRGTFLTNTKGAANITLRGSSLDFDPRGREIEIEDVNDDKLLRGGGGGGSNSSGDDSADERANLVPTGIQPLASGHASYRLKNGDARFKVEIEDVINGTYDILVAGVAQGTITTTGGRGEIEFGDDSGGPALDFDPVGKLIEIALNGDIVLASPLLAGAPGVSSCPPSETPAALIPTAAAPRASGSARFRIRDNCRRDFRVEIEDVPVGAYDLLVAGINRGAITVAVQLNRRVQGEVEFSSDLDNSPSNDRPLEFDPTGATIAIKQGTTLFLSVTMPN